VLFLRDEKALLQRYTRQLDEQETQLDTLSWKIHETEAKRDAANNVLEKNDRRVANRSDDVGEELRNMDLSEMAG
jgi:hypothetical protein